jgi:hypothetical protein
VGSTARIGISGRSNYDIERPEADLIRFIAPVLMLTPAMPIREQRSSPAALIRS